MVPRGWILLTSSATMRLTFAVLSDMSQQTMDELLWNLVQKFTSPSGWVVIHLVILWNSSSTIIRSKFEFVPYFRLWHIPQTFSSAADFHCWPSTAFQLHAHTKPFCWNPSPKTLALSSFITAIQISMGANPSGPFLLTLLELEHQHLSTILLMGVTLWSFTSSFLSHFGKTALSQIPSLTHIDLEIKQNDLQAWIRKWKAVLLKLNQFFAKSCHWHWWRAGVEGHWPVQIS